MRYLLITILLVITLGGATAQPLPSHPSPGSGAFFKSLLIPGWGQLSQDRPKAATFFLASEATLILTSVGMQTYGGWLRNDYRAIAAASAGIPDGGNRAHGMYVDMGNWDTAAEFNQARQRDRDYGRQYISANDQWNWTNDAERERFKHIRLNSDKTLDAVKFAVGAVVLNHLVSAIEASSYTRKKTNPNIGVSLGGTTSQPMANLAVVW